MKYQGTYSPDQEYDHGDIVRMPTGLLAGVWIRLGKGKAKGIAPAPAMGDTGIRWARWIIADKHPTFQ